MHRIVMLLSNSFRPDPRVLKEAESLSELGYLVTVLCWDRLAEFPAKETLSSHIEILRIQNARSEYGIGARQILNLPRFWLSALTRLSKLKPDIIHCHDFDTLPAGLIWGKIHRVPVVYDAHEYYAELVNQRLKGLSGKILFHLIKIAERLFARNANAIVTVDQNLADGYKSIHKNVLIVGHYPRKIYADKYKKVFDKPELTLLYAGRISSDRGALIYIGLLRALLELNLPAQLVLAGTFTPQIEERLFENAAIGLEKSIEYKGWVPYPQVYEILREADVGLSILLPEKRYVASLPVKLFEYMAAGLPVIASNFPSIASIINQAQCGAVVDPGSSPEIIAEIIHQWWVDPSIPQVLGENGRRAILQSYNWERQITELADLYTRLIT